MHDLIETANNVPGIFHSPVHKWTALWSLRSKAASRFQI